MKKFKYILFTVVFSIAVNVVSAQRIGNLDGINYQAVALNDETQEIVGLDIEAKPLYNREIGVRFTITKGLDGEVQWEETHVTTTDAYGLFSLVIGKGTVSSTTYSRLLDMPWIEADQFLKVEISTKNDGSYKTVSNQKFMAVPYAFYTDDIADDAITTEKILNEEILAEDIAEGAVETSEILNETILAEDIAEGAVETSEILNETILAEDIAEGAVETSEILNETILAEDIAEGAIETSEILNETILAEDIAEGAVTTSEILNETILAEDIAEGAVTTSEILNETILNEDIANNTINLTTKVTDILPLENGGTGLDASAVADGEILIGDSTTNEFNLTTLTAGTGIVIENTPGNITIISPPVSTSADGSFNIPVGSNGTIAPNSAWYSPNSLKVDPPVDKPFEMGDIFLASADVDLQGCILSVYLQSIDGNGQANVQVILFNPRNIPVTLQTPVTFKFLLVK
ncbi:hypothetical protein [Seonamhaeicola aphaedonensis]|uniref:Uncharacterized protein n=1 Tax=Seonamhaeicola aphaedonensis TaxID=1461338 RepID=A0A3D9HM43_9FLAO|nr:hypothetical protein [Seonamhaeicola aphaedonensis]RED50567.1 hypothetical protein DFQ02_101601 [Seonamhaeicola aphaedonensis]